MEGIALSFVLTLAIFSYLLGDNWLYRLAVAVFVGVSAAFISSVTLQSVILPLTRETEPILLIVFLGVPLLLVLLLILKPIRWLRPFAALALAFLIAVGAAVALVGALTGTLIPIVADTAAVEFGGEPLEIVNSILLVIGVVTSLLYFQYIARERRDGSISRGRIVQGLAVIGEGFIAITLGALFGTAILTSLSILVGQLQVFFGQL